MFFSVITENLNWEILTKNLVTFKRWVKDGGRSQKSPKTIYRVALLKMRVEGWQLGKGG